MRICIDMGHTPTSPGASGYLDELSCDRETGKRVIAELKARGHAVYDVTAPDSYAYPAEVNYRVAKANGYSNIDLFVSIHLNATAGATGTEVWHYSGDSYGQSVAARISSKVAAALGLANRGAKGTTDRYAVIRETNMTAVLIELCFVDTKRDADAWHACPWDRLIKAICDGIDNGDYPNKATYPAKAPEKPNSRVVQLHHCNNTDAQKWTPVERDGEWFALKSCGLVLDVWDGAKAAKTKVHAYPSNGTDAQRWRFVDDLEGKTFFPDVRPVALEPKNAPGMRLTAKGADEDAGVYIMPADNSLAQQWAVVNDGGKLCLVSVRSKYFLDLKNRGQV